LLRHFDEVFAQLFYGFIRFLGVRHDGHIQLQQLLETAFDSRPLVPEE
jgi:hypothetical protein